MADDTAPTPIPAVCRTCATVFSSGIVAKNSRNLSLSGNTSGPCPNCGGTGDVISGRFDVVGGVITALDRVGYGDLQRVRSILQRDADTEAKIEALQSETPQLWAAIRPYLPSDSAALAGWLAVLLMLVQLWLNTQGGDVVDIDIHLKQSTVIEQVDSGGDHGDDESDEGLPAPRN